MIGRWSGVAGSRISRLFARWFGVADFHTHLRLAWLVQYCHLGSAKVCELGCGTGVALLELLSRNATARAAGFEADAVAVSTARAYARGLDLEQRLTVYQRDLNGTLPDEVAQADYILLLDVLEHLPDPARLARELAERMKPGAHLLLSVPTPLYPRIFGWAFHRRIGHLHAGFTLTDTDVFFAALHRIEHRYSTGPLTWPGIVLYYRIPLLTGCGRHSFTTRLLTALSLPFRGLDCWNAQNISCSLFVDYHKMSACVFADDTAAENYAGCERVHAEA